MIGYKATVGMVFQKFLYKIGKTYTVVGKLPDNDVDLLFCTDPRMTINRLSEENLRSGNFEILKVDVIDKQSEFPGGYRGQ